MKKLALFLVVLCCALVVTAQETPKVQVFGGYQYTNVDTKGLADRLSFNGWDADVAFRAVNHVSVVADVSGAYKSETFDIAGVGAVQGKLRLYNYLFGPRLSYDAGKVVPFGEALFGVGHASVSGSVLGLSIPVTTSNGFAMALGGGLDVPAGKHFALRGKFDYLYNRISAEGFGLTGGSENLNNYRIATGVVFKF